MTPEETARKASAILDELGKAVVGRRRALELVLIERLNVAIERFPERLTGEQRIAIPLRQPFEPAGAQVRGHTRT